MRLFPVLAIAALAPACFDDDPGLATEPSPAIVAAIPPLPIKVEPVPDIGIAQALPTDLDGDDDADLVLIPKSGKVKVYRGRVAGVQATNAVTPTLPADGGRAASGDVDLDGDLDVVVIPSGADPTLTSRILFNRWAEAGTFTLASAPGLLPGTPVPTVPGIPLLVDWDGDGDLDLVVAGTGGATWKFMRNQRQELGHLALTDVTVSMGGPITFKATDAVAGDFDGDGRIDLAATGATGTLLLRNDGVHFVDASQAAGVKPLVGAAIATADFNRDRQDDLYIAGAAKHWLRLGNGGQAMQDVPGLPPARTKPGGAVAPDLDGDGFADLWVTATGEPPLIAVNDPATGTFAARPPPADGEPQNGSRPGAFADHRRLGAVVAVGSLTDPARLFHVAPTDQDCDQLPDGAEAQAGMAPLDPRDHDADVDADRIGGRDEYRLGTRLELAGSGGVADPDALDARLDRDGDGVRDAIDRCPKVVDPTQPDADADGVGDACDEGATAPVIEWRGPGRHRYVGSTTQLVSAARRLAGHRISAAEFRLFSDGANAVALYEIDDPQGPRYLVGATALAAQAALIAAGKHPLDPIVVGYLATSSRRDLIDARDLHSVISDSGDQVLTIDPARVAALVAAGSRDEGVLGQVAVNRGNVSPPRAVVALLDHGRRYYTATPEGDDETVEGTPFAVFLEPGAGMVPLFQIREAVAASAVLTIDPAERAALIAGGGVDDGILGWVFPAEPQRRHVDAVPLQRLRLADGRRRYTIVRDELEDLLGHGATSEGLEGWAVRPLALYGEQECAPSPDRVKLPDAGVDHLPGYLTGIADPDDRARASVMVFNLACSMQRAAAGLATGDTELAMAEKLAGADAVTRSLLETSYSGVAAIPAGQRASLLGELSALDPGACTTAPDWVKIGVILAEPRRTARLRSSWCLGSPTDPSDQSVTVGAELLRPEVPEPDGGDPAPGYAASTARPLIFGVEADYFDPDTLNPTLSGIWPYGTSTGLTCASQADCNADLGHLCGLEIGGSPHCLAFPVVDADGDLEVRGQNFWDSVIGNSSGSMRVRFDPLVGSNDAFVATTRVDVISGSNDVDACWNLQGDNNDGAHFPVIVNPGFYRLTAYNHNGHFLTHSEADSEDHPDPGRVIHVCYPESMGSLEGVDAATPRDCTPPTETCPADGVAPEGTCHAGWPTAPRPLEGACMHSVEDAPPCAETPEWFASEPMNFDGTDKLPIVYVRPAPPAYTVRVKLDAGQCVEESGADWSGSDEVMTAALGFAVAPTRPDEIVSQVEGATGTYMDGDADSGEREHLSEPFVLSRLDGVTIDAEMSYVILVVESDTDHPWLRGAVFAALGGAASAAISTVDGTGASVALGTTVALVAFSINYFWEQAGDDDTMGIESVHGTVADMLHLDSVNAGPDFLDESHASLPHLTELGLQYHAYLEPYLTHLVDDPRIGEDLAIECSPGTCSNGDVCFAQRCVPSASVPEDDEGDARFQDRHRYWSDGYDYGIDLLWTLDRE